MKIPKEFYHGDDHPKAYTVGELKTILRRLPNDLPIKQGGDDGVMLVVYNHGINDDQLAFEETEDDD